MQIGVSVVAVVVKTKYLALTVVVTVCVNVVRWMLRRDNVWRLNFAVKSIFRL